MSGLALALFLLVFAPLAAEPRGKPEPLHPGFTLISADLPRLTSGLPPQTASSIEKAPKAFLEQVLAVMNEPQDLVVLVDKTHALSPDYRPQDLVPVSRYPGITSKAGMKVRSVIVPDLMAMINACNEAGATLIISSSYRDYATQEQLFQAELRTKPRAEVERDLAIPGHSQHQLGTAIDFGSIDTSFADTRAGRWIYTNAWRFGFSLSYPQGQESFTGYTWEPWHYRFVGKPAAALIHDFFADSQQSFLSWYADRKGFLEEHRQK